MKWPTVNLVEGENPWVSYAKKRVYKDNNCINLLVVGAPGSGKSWGLLSYCCAIDPDFDVQEQCFFKAKKLIREFQQDKNIKGKPFMFDEAGIDASNMNWQDEINKALSAFFQTSRYKNYIFGLTVPFQSFLSKGVRKLMTCRFTTEGWTSDNLTKIRPLTLEWNDELEKYYKKRLLVRDKHKVSYCDGIRLPKPPEKIRLLYEKLKKEFTLDLYKELADKIESQEQRDSQDKLLKCSKVAEKIGINQQTMIKWIHHGLINTSRIGKFFFMTQAEYEKLLNNPILLNNPKYSKKIS